MANAALIERDLTVPDNDRLPASRQRGVLLDWRSHSVIGTRDAPDLRVIPLRKARPRDPARLQ